MRFIILVIVSILIISCSNSGNNQSKDVEPVLAMLQTNCQDSLRKLTDMAEAGNSCAQYNLGVVYLGDVLHVDCVKPNKGLAIKWLEASAKNKYEEAYSMLGAVYEGGHVVEKDLKKAFNYYSLGVGSKNKVAMHHLGLMCLKGEGGTKDVDKAISLLKSASDLGNYDSTMVLGRIYFDGKFVRKDNATALRYLKVATNSGKEEAKIAYNSVLHESLSDALQSKTFSSEEYSNMGDQFYDLAKFAYDRQFYNDAQDCYVKATKCYYVSCYGVDGSDTSKNYDYPACKKFVQLKFGRELKEQEEIINKLNGESK